ncbi:hypothetical protein [Asticcacaulis sp. AND118]|uniref:hypothetical protein n=1 Tax=Asticcacaulis sp. AND118 TaxID=2840468 RepID=UPI001CFFF5BB|nr:hypothetical protein [Asticcacaulis sp. AND118]UDF04454.1 hypothetical protein LH365_05295 [Asticcacaulis sp. AND118]
MSSRDERPVYIRFVCFKTVEGHRHALGIFQARDDASVSEYAEGWALSLINEAYDWFCAHLKEPDRTHADTRWRPGNPGLSWFKPDAFEHIQRMYDMKMGLEACGIHVDVLTTRDVGQVLYEDAHQICAVPSARTFA